MPTETFDVHGVEPVPARDRTSSSGDQFWIWMGANIAPINWASSAAVAPTCPRRCSCC